MRRPPIINPDTNRTDYAYWNEVLKTHGLSIRRGDHHDTTVLVGGAEQIAGLDEEQRRKNPERVV
jgi:hypothetical protein